MEYISLANGRICRLSCRYLRGSWNSGSSLVTFWYLNNDWRSDLNWYSVYSTLNTLKIWTKIFWIDFCNSYPNNGNMFFCKFYKFNAIGESNYIWNNSLNENWRFVIWYINAWFYPYASKFISSFIVSESQKANINEVFL